MHIIFVLLSFAWGYETTLPSQQNTYPLLAQMYAQKSSQQYPVLNLAEEPSAPYYSDDDETLPPQPVQMQALVPEQPPKPTNTEELLTETWRLKQENKMLSERIASMEFLLAENNRMLRALLEATQQTGVELENVEKNQEQITNDLMGLASKMRQWKNDILQSQEHPLHKVLRYLRLGINISASTGTALSTYYTFAWVTSVLPAVLTPPGWILITTSATAGALYYILYAV
ncbi:MAG: hypothetical protein KF798_03935 [Candidatus Paracaedibacteraceae bacterium]|nr:hypothetical protein [Candidatus Paracaedibacteraceae bacterium]